LPNSIEIKQAKNLLRKEIYAKQALLPASYFAEKDALLQHEILAHKKVKQAKVVLSYWSMPKEAGTQNLNEELAQEKKVLLPVINGAELMLKAFEGADKMKPESKYGIFEPVGQEFSLYHEIDVVLVPGLAFSLAKQRCGHGKGFYDKLLPKIKNAYFIGYCYHYQIVKNIPTDDFDYTMHEIVYK